MNKDQERKYEKCPKLFPMINSEDGITHVDDHEIVLSKKHITGKTRTFTQGNFLAYTFRMRMLRRISVKWTTILQLTAYY